MNNGFLSDDKWAGMLNTYQNEKRNGFQMMQNWKECYRENQNLQRNQVIVSQKKFDGFNPIRDRFSSQKKDKAYYDYRTRSFASKKRVNKINGTIFFMFFMFYVRRVLIEGG
jgi:hypothetical protein